MLNKLIPRVINVYYSSTTSSVDQFLGRYNNSNRVSRCMDRYKKWGYSNLDRPTRHLVRSVHRRYGNLNWGYIQIMNSHIIDIIYNVDTSNLVYDIRDVILKRIFGDQSVLSLDLFLPSLVFWLPRFQPVSFPLSPALLKIIVEIRQLFCRKGAILVAETCSCAVAPSVGRRAICPLLLLCAPFR